MSEEVTRRDVRGRGVRGTVAVGLAGSAAYLVKKADGQVVWQVDPAKCINSELGNVGV
ncbi:MAG: hypothetical protein GY953_31050, partial [bacterium]|nr:hypothetical protein [bacterium]